MVMHPMGRKIRASLQESTAPASPENPATVGTICFRSTYQRSWMSREGSGWIHGSDQWVINLRFPTQKARLVGANFLRAIA